jgi:hypothetical protein
MHLVILHYYNVTWLSIPLWIYGKTWTPWGFFNMGNTLPKSHQIIRIAYNNNPNVIHGGIITLSNAYHKATKWFFHHMNDLVLFRKYTRSLDIVELSVLITFLLLITIGDVCMLKSETSLLGVNNVIEWKLFFPLDNSRFFSTPYSGHVLLLVMWVSWKVTTTPRRNVYIMIMIEHFSKWVEFVALPDKYSYNIS